MFGYLLPLVSPEWLLFLKVREGLSVEDLLVLRPTEEAFLLTYLQVKGHEALVPDPVEGSQLRRGRKRGYKSLSDNTSLYLTVVGEVVERRNACRGEDAQNDLKEWYEAAFTHAQEASKAMRDLPAEDEEHDNVLQVTEGANRKEGSRGGHSIAQVMSELGVNGNWEKV